MSASLPPADRLAHLGWDARWDDARTGHPTDHPTDLDPGRVVRVDRGLWSVLSEHGLERVGLCGDLLGEYGDDPVAAPCVGDWVLLRRWCDGRTTLEHVLPRRTAVVRGQASGTSLGQALAANVDVAAVVAGLDREPSVGRIERLLTLAWESGAAPAVVLTKADLAPDAHDVAEDVAAASPETPVVVCSTVDGRGLDDLAALVGGGTLALLGSSGAGKSTLVNALVGADVLATKQIRADGRGRHTSVRRELVLLPAGGCVIDTPGLRGVGLSAEGDGIAAAFADVEGLTARCRFSDCSHEGEPDCAVREALDTGALPRRRYESWRKLQREAAYVARRHDARLRASEPKVWRQRTKDGRAGRRKH